MSTEATKPDNERLVQASTALKDAITAFLKNQGEIKGNWAITVSPPNSPEVFILKGNIPPSTIKIFQRPELPSRQAYDARENVPAYLEVLGKVEERRYHYAPPMAAASFPEGQLEPHPPIPGRDFTLYCHPDDRVTLTRQFGEQYDKPCDLPAFIEQLAELLKEQNPTFFSFNTPSSELSPY